MWHVQARSLTRRAAQGAALRCSPSSPWHMSGHGWAMGHGGRWATWDGVQEQSVEWDGSGVRT